MKTPRKAKGRAAVKLAGQTVEWPDPPMVPSYALRHCEAAESIEEVRAIVRKYLPPRSRDGYGYVEVPRSN